MNTFVLFAVIVLLVVFGLKQIRKSSKEGCCSTGDTIKKIRPKDTNLADYPYTTTLHVNDMHCAHCAIKVENAFNALDDHYAKADLDKKIVTIHSKQKNDTNTYIGIVARAGYSATE